MMDKKDISLILELCKFKSPDPERLAALIGECTDFPGVLGQLLYNRMGGAAYYTLEKCALLSDVNREFRNTLKAIYMSNRLQTDSFLKARDLLAGVLAGVDVPYALLKGGYLVGLYPNGLRTSNDFDLLVSQRDIKAIADCLRSSGFQQGYIRENRFIPATRAEILSSRMNRGETVPFIREIGLPMMPFCEVDINFSLDFQARQHTDTVSVLLGRAEKRIETASGWLFTLSPADFALHLCAHLYKEATVFNWVEMGRDLSLYKFSDLYLLLADGLDAETAEQIARRAAEHGLQKECTYALRYTKELYGMENPKLDYLLETIVPTDLSFMKRILRPADNRVFQYDMPFIDWMFCHQRKEMLYETEYAAT